MTGTPGIPRGLGVLISFSAGYRRGLVEGLNTVWPRNSGTEAEDEATGSAREFWKAVAELKR